MISAQVDDGEIFDTEKLKKTADFLIQNEVRNLIVDLGDLDYLYSDGINALIGVNKKMIQVAGRLGILVRTAKVKEIAESAGLDNMMKIYTSEEEVKKDSKLIAPGKPAAKKVDPPPPPVPESKTQPSKPDEEIESKIEQALTPVETQPEVFKEDELLPLGDPEEKDKGGNVSPSQARERLSETEEIAALSSATDETESSAFSDLGLGKAPESEGDSSDELEDPSSASRGRLGPQDRLRNPSGRVKPVKRTGGRQWEESEEANTGLIITDDTVSGKIVKTEKNIPRPDAYNLLAEESKSKFPTIIIGIILLALVGGGFYWVKNNTGLLKGASKLETEKPYIPDADKEAMFDTSAVDSAAKVSNDTTVEEETFMEDEEEVTEKSSSKPKSVSSPKSSRPASSSSREESRPSKSASSGESIRITSNPSGAEVMVNFAKKGETPLNIDLQNKTNIVIVKKEGYKKFQTKISRDDHENSLNVDLEPEASSSIQREVTSPDPEEEVEPEPEPEPEPAGPPVIRVTSTPSGADVLVNFSNKGKTPIEITLGNKSNTIIVSKSGYKKYQTKLLNTTTKTSLNVELESDEPEAPKASTPPPREKPKEVTRPEPTEEPKTTSPSSAPVGTGPIGRVFLASRPPGADVIVDGKEMGFQTPHWLEIPSGSHSIKLTKGAQSVTKQIMVRPGKNKSEYIILK